MVAWTFGVYMVLPASAVDAHPNGSLVVSGSTVFRIMGGERQGFPSANVFLSHGYMWSHVVPANSADLALPQGTNLMLADGTLVNDGGTVYIISGGQKLGFTSAAVFTGLGYEWVDVISDNLSSYTQGANVSSATAAHPAGTLVNSSGTIWHMAGSERHGIPTLAVFASNGFDFADVVPANSADLAVAAGANLGYRVGSLVNDSGTIFAVTSSTEKRGFPTASCFTDFGFMWPSVLSGSTAGLTAGANLCDGSVTPPTSSSTGTLTVSLASDTPAAGIAIKSAARVGFTKVNLTATGGDVVVDTWSVKRTGVGQDSSFASVDIIDLSTNTSINESGKTFNTDHIATFSEDFTVKSGETKSVMMAGNMAASPGSGEVPSLTLQAMTLKGGTLNGSFPVTGNGMTINTSITIGTATVQRGSYTNATNTALEVGKQDYTFFSFQIQAGSAEDVTFNSVKVYQQGSASLSTDLEDYKLYRDGELLGTGTIAGNYLIFSFPMQTLTKGQTGQYLVKADVKGGSARTVDLGIYRTTDLLVKGTTYNAYITPTYSGAGSSNSSNPVISDNTFTISTGSLRVGRSNTVGSENITIGNSQVLGAFEFEAKGEPVIITALTLTITSSAGAQIENAVQGVKLVDANGNTLAGPTDDTSGSTNTIVFSDTFTLPVGVSHVKVLANLATNGGWATNDTIFAGINSPATAITAKGDNTSQTLTPTPSSNISTATQTVKAAGLTVTKNSTPTHKNVITNAVGVLAGSWNFDASNSGEDVRLTSIAIRASSTGKLNNLTLKDVASPGGTVNAALSPVNDAPTAGTSASSTFALSSPLVITKGTTKTVDLYVDVGSNSVAGEVNSFGCNGGCLTAYGVTTGNSATVTTVNDDGARLTIVAAGTLSVNLDSSAPSIRQVVFGSTGVTLSDVRLKATNEGVKVTKLTVGIVDGDLTGTNSGDYTQVSKFYLKKDGATVGSATGYAPGQANTVVNLGVNDLVIPEGTTGVKLSILGDLVAIGTNQPGEANDDLKVGLGPILPQTAGAAATSAFNAVGASSNTTATMSYTDSTGSAITLHRSAPSVVIKTPSNSLTATAVLHEADISAVGNTVGLYRLSYAANSSAGINVTNGYIKLASCTGGGCGGVADGSQLSATVTEASNVGGIYAWTFTVVNTQAHGKKFLQISAGATAKVQLVGTVTGFSTNSDSVSTSLLGDTATSTSANDPGGQPAAAFIHMVQGNFVWSDLNADDTDSTGLTSKQWYNGYYVTGLGATATTTAVTVKD